MSTECESDGDSIFVSIVCYRDPQCLPTIRSLLTQCARPQNVFIGIVWQYDPDEDAATLFSDWPALYERGLIGANRIRQLFLSHHQARGPHVARAYADGLRPVGGACRYYLQIDCHMRFAKAWDDALIAQCTSAPSSRPVITGYPVGYDGRADDDDDTTAVWISQQKVPLLCAANRFAADGQPRLIGRNVIRPPPPPVRSLFAAAGFLFGPMSIQDELPHSFALPNLFFGEEMLLAARLYTRGYDCFVPTTSLIAHQWSRNQRIHNFREVSGTTEHESARRQSLLLVHNVLTGQFPSTSTWIGTERSLSEWYAFCDIDFIERRIGRRALNGGLSADALAPTADMQLRSLIALARVGGHNG